METTNENTSEGVETNETVTEETIAEANDSIARTTFADIAVLFADGKFKSVNNAAFTIDNVIIPELAVPVVLEEDLTTEIGVATLRAEGDSLLATIELNDGFVTDYDLAVMFPKVIGEVSSINNGEISQLNVGVISLSINENVDSRIGTVTTSKVN